MTTEREARMLVERLRDSSSYRQHPNLADRRAAADLIERQASELSRREGGEPVAWIVGNANRTKWRAWDSCGPIWVDDRAKATRYARREDAENVHREDEDAWAVEPYGHPIASTPDCVPIERAAAYICRLLGREELSDRIEQGWRPEPGTSEANFLLELTQLRATAPTPESGERALAEKILRSVCAPGDPVEGLLKKAKRLAAALIAKAEQPLWGLLDNLQHAEAEYRLMHDRHGDDSRASGRAWDLMRRAGDKARAALANPTPEGEQK